eukprot:CAMPEP_0119069480 /NCGR_PEP_ID=MMETSP1178-20130426/19585_1 /TAXON_ID=33656 /ORGANISM="unid sp, Strain CCMP2000" /LENGTH=139 /DNA_ID=CAMNT_0007051249 /DNA_START=126 /DNA_END=545 /DNA_ORIENTATION=-
MSETRAPKSVVLRIPFVWIISILYPLTVLVYHLNLAPKLELLAKRRPRVVYAAPVVPFHELAPYVVAHAANTQQCLICASQLGLPLAKLDTRVLGVDGFWVGALEPHVPVLHLKDRVCEAIASVDLEALAKRQGLGKGG